MPKKPNGSLSINYLKLLLTIKKLLIFTYQRLQSKLSYQPIGFDLLPKEFLFSDLETLYSSILNRTIDRRNFRKKILSFDILEETQNISKNNTG
jgi:8-oxo-dGTP diphosphatase